MQTVLIIFQLFISIALIVVVLLQKSEGGAFGMGGGGASMGGLFSPRGVGDALTRATAILGVLFFVVSIALTLLALNGGSRQASSILDSAPKAPVSAPKSPAAPPATPAVPQVPKPAP